VESVSLQAGVEDTDRRVVLQDQAGRELIAYQSAHVPAGDVPPPATEPPLPGDVRSIEELHLIGTHLDQYRHATRMPEDYWREALKREPGDSRCNTAMGWWHLRRGEWEEAAASFGRAAATVTHWNPNPREGEPFYGWGIALRNLERFDEAYDALAKAAWNAPWQVAAWFEMARIDCRRNAWGTASELLERVLSRDGAHLQARHLKAILLQRMGDEAAAHHLLDETRRLDPLDFAATWLRGCSHACNRQARLDLAFEFSAAGFHHEALGALFPNGETSPAPAVEVRGEDRLPLTGELDAGATPIIF
jgi:Tfp pilus assembly protein PilF